MHYSNESVSVMNRIVNDLPILSRLCILSYCHKSTFENISTYVVVGKIGQMSYEQVYDSRRTKKYLSHPFQRKRCTLSAFFVHITRCQQQDNYLSFISLLKALTTTGKALTKSTLVTLFITIDLHFHQITPGGPYFDFDRKRH